MSDEEQAAIPVARPRPITASAFHKALVDGGVIRDGEHVSRIVIDARANDCVVIHVERFGDERLLDVVRSLEGVEVHCGEPAIYDNGGFLPAGLMVARNETGESEEVSAP